MTATPNAIIRAIPVTSIAAPSHIRTQNGHDRESLTNLADSIKTHGMIQPIVVRHGDEEGAEFVVVAGRRRLAASKIAGFELVPCIVSTSDEAHAYELEIAENIQREQMTLADTARAVRTLLLIHDKPVKVAQIVNKSPAWVSKHLTITAPAFPATIAELLDRGIVSDLETLLLLAQIAKQPASNPKAMATLTRMLKIAHAGDMTRQIARDALATLKAKNATDADPDGEGEGDDEGDGQAVTRGEKFGKLELAHDTAKVLLAALEYAKEHKPSSRPSDALLEHVRNFIAKTWP